MKNKSFAKSIFGFMGAMLLIGGFWIGDAKASNGNLHFVATMCTDTATGQILGLSNDCHRGSSNCADNDCSRFANIR